MKETLWEGPFDILHIGSTLQYIDDWKGLLNRLILSYTPRYCVFSDLLAGDIPTFVSHQLFYGQRIPVRFYNFHDFCLWMTSKKYTLLYRSLFETNILGKESVPMEALPVENRISRTMNCFFQYAHN